MADQSLKVRLRQIRLEAQGIVSLEFVAADGGALPGFTAGAHVDFLLPGEKVRSYSLLNDPRETHRYVIAVLREAEGRGGSVWLHDRPRVGDVLEVRPPVNDFALADTPSESVLVAGGIGITPLLSMARQLEREGRPWRLHYAARSPAHAAFLDELRALDAGRGRVTLHCGEAGQVRLDMAAAVAAAPADAHFYGCGPARMIEAFQAACAARPSAQVHLERFAASSEAATAGGFELVLQRSGQRIAVAPGKTILDALLDHAVSVQYACSAGVCGTCMTGVIEGEPDHRDEYLTDEERRENRQIMICCSGSKSPTLVLDL
ncbi:PDR/VanB family oxidoreductase [Hydrogenophaga sp.]|uniref:PDR/VanB family oxidoreductase n=1 Tax=Hydrogenophaga sp. TaxID=1904254 RepID=UPI002605C731|nr:PDR/VanB family oxidoreductase [Hydrogenophaga sp.]MCW5653777.1 oxidoreductase [Hydrogenophaga sp.]